MLLFKFARFTQIPVTNITFLGKLIKVSDNNSTYIIK